MPQLDISNVINVSLTGVPQGIAVRNVNNIGFFTTDSPSNIDIYRDYFSAREVAADYGSTSDTANMADALFAQSPNIMTGDGALRIIPMLGSIDATHGKFVTATLTTNIPNIIAVTNGSLRAVIDGTNVDATEIDFSLATGIDDIATILQAKFSNLTVTNSTTTITFTSKTYGIDSTVTLAAVSPATGTDLSGATYLSASTGTATAGTNSSGGASTAGTFTTADISANLTAIYAITDGKLTISVDGTSHTYTGITFSGATTIANVATILAGLVSGVTITNTSDTIIFTSDTIGSNSAVTFAASPTGGTDLYGNGYLELASGTAAAGTDVAGETLIQAIARTEESISYCGVMSNLEMEEAPITATASFIQARDMIYVQEFSSTAQLTGVIKDITDATETHTRCLLYTIADVAPFMKAAYIGRGFSTNFDGVDTSSTMNLKTLATIDPDLGINQTIYDVASTVGADLYVSYSGVPAVVSNGTNLYFDQIYSRLSIKFYLQAGGFNYLRQTNTKIPQTEPGMVGLKDAYITNALNPFVVNGYIGQGLIWNSSETFGNPVTFRENITSNGYYVYSIPIAQQIQSEREARKAPLIQIAIKESGSIDNSDVLVVVEA